MNGWNFTHYQTWPSSHKLWAVYKDGQCANLTNVRSEQPDDQIGLLNVSFSVCIFLCQLMQHAVITVITNETKYWV